MNAPSGQVPLYLDEDDRYSRMRLISWWDQEKLRGAKALVVGAGALGNEVLKNLALLGWGTILAIDFDSIEESNLTRSVLFRSSDCGKTKAEVAAAAVRGINPDVRIIPVSGNVLTDLGLGVFLDIDVVFGCLDNREARLWVNRQCWKANKPWVDGGIQEISGVVKTFVPGQGACYECAMTDMDYRLINLRYSCPLLSQEDLAMGRVPTAPTISSMIAGLQVQEGLKLLHNRPVRAGCATVFDGHSNQMYTTELPYKADCLSHETLPEIVTTELSAGDPLAKAFAWIRERAREEPPRGKLALRLAHDLVCEATCGRCGVAKTIMRPRPLVPQREATCATCGEFGRPNLISTILEGDPLADESMQRLGVAPYDVARFVAEDDPDWEKAALLAGDRERVWPMID